MTTGGQREIAVTGPTGSAADDTDGTSLRLVLESFTGQAWAGEARCRGRSHLFFGRPNERPEARQRREVLAASYCAICPALEACRAWARDHGESGFWGGESEEARAAAGHPPRAVTRRSVAAAVAEPLRRRRQAS